MERRTVKKCVLQETTGEFYGHRAKSCRAGWKVAYDLSYRHHSVLAHFKQLAPVPTCKIVRVSVRTTQLDFTKAGVKVSWFARCAKLLVVFWGFGKLCCDGDGK